MTKDISVNFDERKPQDRVLGLTIAVVTCTGQLVLSPGTLPVCCSLSLLYIGEISESLIRNQKQILKLSYRESPNSNLVILKQG